MEARKAVAVRDWLKNQMRTNCTSEFAAVIENWFDDLVEVLEQFSDQFPNRVSLQERVDVLEKALAEKNAIIEAAYRGCHCGSDPEWKRIGHKPTCWKALHFAFSQPKPSTEPGGVK